MLQVFYTVLIQTTYFFFFLNSVLCWDCRTFFMEIIVTHLVFFKLKRECLSKPFCGSKEHAVHLFAYRSPYCQKKPLWNKSFQKLARTIVGKESTIETLPKKVAGRGQKLQWSELEHCLYGPFTAMGGRSHQALVHGWNLRRPKKLLMEHPNHFGLQHVVSPGWCWHKTLPELVNKLPELLTNVHYLQWKN